MTNPILLMIHLLDGYLSMVDVLMNIEAMVADPLTVMIARQRKKEKIHRLDC